MEVETGPRESYNHGIVGIQDDADLGLVGRLPKDLPAMATTLSGYIGACLAITHLRPRDRRLIRIRSEHPVARCRPPGTALCGWTFVRS
jgi:hypothetical protein